MRGTVEDRTVVRGRRIDPIDRLPPNETGLEAQPSRFSAGMWAVILFVSSEAVFFGALFMRAGEEVRGGEGAGEGRFVRQEEDDGPPSDRRLGSWVFAAVTVLLL